MDPLEELVADTETNRVERWRLEELLRAGYPTSIALELATAADVDLHQAVELLGQGCAPELAAQILL